MSDVTVPGFSRRVSQGEVFFNPMSHVKVTMGSGSAGPDPKIRSKTATCSGQLFVEQTAIASGCTTGRLASLVGLPFRYADGSLSVYASMLNASEVNRAITEVCTSVASKRGRADSNLYETIAESEQSAGILREACVNVNRFLDKKRGLRRQAQALSSAYLLYRYGLKPLMMDVASAAEGLTKVVGRVRSTSRASVSFSQTSVAVAGTNSYGGIVSFPVDRTTVETLEIRAMSLDEYVASVSSNIGFTAKGLLTLPWELLPYSFVADWFANIGDLIGALTPSFGYTQLGSCVVRRGVRIDTDVVGVNSPIPSGYSVTTPLTGSCDRVWSYTTRTPGLVAPGLALKSDFRLTNLTRAADALALIVQKLR
jgi:hypothetical protein